MQLRYFKQAEGIDAATFAGEVPIILKLNSHETLLSDKDPISVQTGSIGEPQQPTAKQPAPHATV